MASILEFEGLCFEEICKHIPLDVCLRTEAVPRDPQVAPRASELIVPLHYVLKRIGDSLKELSFTYRSVDVIDEALSIPCPKNIVSYSKDVIRPAQPFDIVPQIQTSKRSAVAAQRRGELQRSLNMGSSVSFSPPLLNSSPSPLWNNVQRTLREELFKRAKPSLESSSLALPAPPPESEEQAAGDKDESSDTDGDRAVSLTDASVSSAKSRVLPFDDALKKLPEMIGQCGDTIQSANAFPVLQFCYRYLDIDLATDFSRTLQLQWADGLAQNGFVDLCTKLWPSLFSDEDAKDVLQTKDTDGPEFLAYTYIADILCNGADISAKLAEEISKSPLIGNMLKVLARPCFDDLEWLKLPNSIELIGAVDSFLSTIHNCLRHCRPLAKEVFRAADGLSIVTRFFRIEISPLICAFAVFILARATNEDESHLICAGSDLFEYVVSKLLRVAVESKKHSAKGATVEELVDGLNALSKNETNKAHIGNSGALELYERILKAPLTEAELATVAKGFWILSFLEQNKKKILAMPDTISNLEKLQDSKNEQIQKAASGLLWNLGLTDRLRLKSAGKSKQRKDTGAATATNQAHIMISYQWSYKPIVIKVNKFLKAAGYRTWMDIDEMTGSTLDAMANAVEKAVVVLVFFSEEYKNSPSCRQEAEYAARIQKDIVPVSTQYHYKPNGWLGIILGTKLYFDCSTLEKVDANFGALAKELGDRGRVDSSSLISSSRPFSAVAKEKDKLPSSPPLSTWTNADVSKWLQKIGLESYAAPFARITGVCLQGLLTMSERAPEAYYRTLEQKFSWSDTADYLVFAEELQNLRRK